MARKSLEIVQSIYREISARREFPRECFAPGCVVDFSGVAPDGGLAVGIDAANAAIAPYFRTFEDFQVEPEEIVHADQQRVVIAIRDGGRIKGSDARIASRYFHAWTLRGERVIRLSSHTDRSAALSAVGLAD